MRIVRLLATLGVALCVLAGCSTVAAEHDSLPEGVTLSVHQGRSDLGERRLQVAVTNATTEQLTITGLELASEQFVATAVWAKASTTIAAGATADLPVLLAAPACAARGGTEGTAEQPVAVVRLDYRLGEGAASSGSGIPNDPADRLAAIDAEDCFAASVLEHAALELRTLPREVMTGGRLLAELDLEITPTGADGEAHIDGVLDTVLLGIVDARNGRAIDELPLNLVIGADSAPSVVTLLLAPGRCDSHAIAEDKRGTIFPVRATTDSATGIVSLASTDAVRRALYDFVQRSCAG